jgi:esterase/lipase
MAMKKIAMSKAERLELRDKRKMEQIAQRSAKKEQKTIDSEYKLRTAAFKKSMRLAAEGSPEQVISMLVKKSKNSDWIQSLTVELSYQEGLMRQIQHALEDLRLCGELAPELAKAA